MEFITTEDKVNWGIYTVFSEIFGATQTAIFGKTLPNRQGFEQLTSHDPMAQLG
jgi:hypothetical protein